MGVYVIRTPDIGEGIAEVELVAWHVKPGDEVKEDQVLADVMTDKATVEIPSPISGVVTELIGDVGQLVPVGGDLVKLQVDGAGNRDAEVIPDSLPSQERAAEGARATTKAPASSHTSPSSKRAEKILTPTALANGPGIRTPIATRVAGEKPIASPSVRRQAWELGVELQYVHGSGLAGNVTHEDLHAYLTSQSKPMRGRGSVTYAERNEEQHIPLIGLRRKIAQKMQEAKRRIPHFSYVEEVDVTELEALRVKLNAKYTQERGKLTLLPFIARAVVIAVRDFPQMNGRFDDDAGVVTQHGAVHLGLAAQTPMGLMVPVVQHAETLDIWACSAEILRLAKAAREGKATREELSGSTITISSLGALGGIVTTPVINHPEVAIIGVNRMVERPVIRQGTMVVRQMMNLSSSFDHRVVDGLDAAEFIQAIRALLESPALLFVE